MDKTPAALKNTIYKNFYLTKSQDYSNKIQELNLKANTDPATLEVNLTSSDYNEALDNVNEPLLKSKFKLD